MRPVSLVLEGFGPFRERVEVDFGDSELFALVGPTGSGKSSVIDAVTFALYGSVARYGNERLVHPVINQRCSTALVDLVFTVGDRTYRVTREAVRRGAGGSIREARLEHGEQVVAAGKEVTDAVTDLLGLDFGQFTTCVVLPQGEFARFLHETTKGREELLKRLLDLGVYDQVGQQARSRAKQYEVQRDQLDGQLVELRDQIRGEPEDLARQARALAGVLADLDEARPGIEAADREVAEARARADRAGQAAGLLQAVRAPDDLASRVEATAAADLELQAATDVRDRAEAEVGVAEQALAEIPDRAATVAALEGHERLAELRDRLTPARQAAERARAAAVDAEAALGAAEAAQAEAEAAYHAAERDHAAHALALDLEVGSPCPVCHQPVTDLPSHDLADLNDRRAACDTARSACAGARAGAAEAASAASVAAERLGGLEGQIAEVEARLVDEPDVDTLEDRLGRWSRAEAALAAARVALGAARDQQEQATARRKKLDKLLRSAWDQLDSARDPIVVLGAPPVDRDDLAGSWASLTSWAAAAATTHEQAAADARRQVDTLARQAEVTLAALVAQAGRLGVEVPGDASVEPGRYAVAAGALRDRLVRAEATTSADQERAEEIRRLQVEWLDRRDHLEADRRVADELGRLLRTGGFVTWLLGEAVGQLLTGASVRLRSLSQGRYSLATDDKAGFLVVDHANADEARLARSLSGGETFLASLALALALADEVARLSATGAPRLESIFLDEGFGTLDPETLDVVVSAIEDLQAGGRMVGLVSHVAEVADRVPVRFEVRKDPTAVASTIERVVA